MHSTYQRISTIFSHASTAVMCLLGLVALSSLVMSSEAPPGTVEIKSLQVMVGRQTRKGSEEYGFTRFDINADMKPLFNWNTKQVFTYLVADYTSTTNATNSIVIWDRIIRRPHDAHVRISDARSKYPLREVSGSFQGAAPVQFRLVWNVMPWVGLLTTGEAARALEPVEWPAARKSVK